MSNKVRTAKFLLEQIEKLKEEYEEVVAREKDAVIKKVIDAITTYDIKIEDLKKALQKELAADSWNPPVNPAPMVEPPPPPPAPVTPSKHTGPWVKKPQGKRPTRYKDDKGNEWSGWSRVPGWIREHEANGGSREDFRVKDH